MDDLQEELSSSGVEDEDGSIDGLCGQVPFKSLEKKSKSEKYREVNVVCPHPDNSQHTV